VEGRSEGVVVHCVVPVCGLNGRNGLRLGHSAALEGEEDEVSAATNAKFVE